MIYGLALIVCVIATLVFIGNAIHREWRSAWLSGITAALALGVYAFNVPPQQAQASSDVTAEAATAAPTSADSSMPMVGDTVTVRHGEGLGCPGTRDGLHRLIDAVVAKDETGMSDAIYNSGGFQLANGDRVRAIQQEGFAGLDERIRMLSGDHVGEACWVEADVHIF